MIDAFVALLQHAKEDRCLWVEKVFVCRKKRKQVASSSYFCLYLSRAISVSLLPFSPLLRTCEAGIEERRLTS